MARSKRPHKRATHEKIRKQHEKGPAGELTWECTRCGKGGKGVGDNSAHDAICQAAERAARAAERRAAALARERDEELVAAGKKTPSVPADDSL